MLIQAVHAKPSGVMSTAHSCWAKAMSPVLDAMRSEHVGHEDQTLQTGLQMGLQVRRTCHSSSLAHREWICVHAPTRLDRPRKRFLTDILATPKLVDHLVNTEFEDLHGRANSMPRGKANWGRSHTCTPWDEASFTNNPLLCRMSPEFRFIWHATLAKSLL
jgi:hypothetical protein